MSDTNERSVASTGSVDAPVAEATPTFERELCDLINRHGMERLGNTPDWVLARLLIRTLDAYASAVVWASPFVNVAAERERIINALPGGQSVDPQWVADMVRNGEAEHAGSAARDRCRNYTADGIASPLHPMVPQ